MTRQCGSFQVEFNTSCRLVLLAELIGCISTERSYNNSDWLFISNSPLSNGSLARLWIPQKNQLELLLQPLILTVRHPAQHLPTLKQQACCPTFWRLAFHDKLEIWLFRGRKYLFSRSLRSQHVLRADPFRKLLFIQVAKRNSLMFQGCSW